MTPEEILLTLTAAQKAALLPFAKDRTILPRELVVWKTNPGHRFPSLKLSNLGYKVRNLLNENNPSLRPHSVADR